MERYVYLAIVISASFALGFLAGHTCAARKYTKKQKKLEDENKALENFKHAVKVLCPKIKSDAAPADYLPEKIKGTLVPIEEDEDTKTAERKLP